MPENTPAPLSPHYYRDNFLLLCVTVQARYGDILDAAEIQVLDCLQALHFDAQCLYIRLVSRTGPWFRESKLDYPEIESPNRALDALLGTGMALRPHGLEVQELGQLFTRPELDKAFAPHLAGATLRGKAELLDAIADLALDDAQTLALLRRVDAQRIVAPAHGELIDTLQLLFFGNRRQDLTDFVLEDLGVTRHYPYALDQAGRLFADRAALDEYQACAALSDAHYELVELGLADQLPALAGKVAEVEVNYTSSRSRYYRLCNNLARDLERLEETTLASTLYARSERHPARERRARILEKAQDFQAARDLCADILAAPWCEAEQEAATRILPRVLRKLGEKPIARRRDSFRDVSVELEDTGERVELLVARHLQADWPAVHYLENSLFNSLFGLAFWEEIFSPVPGVFHHPYQAGPSDMYEPAFCQRRGDLIARRLQQLQESDLARELAAAYRRYHPYQCRWVDWRRVDEALVEAAARVIPAKHLVAIFERLLFDPRENRSGFPDLVALGENCGDYCLVEVKGPGDALQDSQKRWLRFFHEHDIPAQVARVDWRREPPTGETDD